MYYVTFPEPYVNSFEALKLPPRLKRFHVFLLEVGSWVWKCAMFRPPSPRCMFETWICGDGTCLELLNVLFGEGRALGIYRYIMNSVVIC